MLTAKWHRIRFRLLNVWMLIMSYFRDIWPHTQSWHRLVFAHYQYWLEILHSWSHRQLQHKELDKQTTSRLHYLFTVSISGLLLYMVVSFCFLACIRGTFIPWPCIVTYISVLRTWPRYRSSCQGSFRSPVIYRIHPDIDTHTHLTECSLWTVKVVSGRLAWVSCSQHATTTTTHGRL